MTSGRFTPAAATFTSTSPSAGCGSGRCSGTSMSGPPGARMAITVICAGNAGIETDPLGHLSGRFSCDAPENAGAGLSNGRPGV